MVWCPNDTQSTDANALQYHAMTRLVDGRLSIIVDPGAWTNLIGVNLAKQIADRGLAAGQRPAQSRMQHPIDVAGVGDGTQRANWMAHLPIAVPNPDGSAVLHGFESPILDQGSGANLPGLLGLRSLRAKRSVLEMTAGREVLTFPGPGGYTINWSPGTIHIPLITAPSGHLVIVCDAYNQLANRSGGIVPRSLTLHANTTSEEPDDDDGPISTSPPLGQTGASSSSTSR